MNPFLLEQEYINIFLSAQGSGHHPLAALSCSGAKLLESHTAHGTRTVFVKKRNPFPNWHRCASHAILKISGDKTDTSFFPLTLQKVS